MLRYIKLYCPLQSYMGLVKDASAQGNVWQMDKEMGADEDDSTFMEASPMEDSQVDDEDEPASFPVGKVASTGECLQELGACPKHAFCTHDCILYCVNHSNWQFWASSCQM